MFSLDYSKFLRPIRQRQAESLHIGMSATKRRFHFGEFPAAAVDFTLEIYFAGAVFGGHSWPVLARRAIW